MPRDREAGVSLLEAMIVVACLFLLVGCFLPLLEGLAAAWELRNAASMLETHLIRARGEAVTLNAALHVRARSSGGEMVTCLASDVPLRRRVLPGNTVISDAPSRPVTFYSRGVAVPAGSFYLSREGKRAKVVVSGAGRVRWEWLSE